MTEKTKIGYIISIAPKTQRGREVHGLFDLLSYGRGHEPAPDQLLRRIGRATMFTTMPEAEAALKATLATAEGAVWSKKFRYTVIEVECAVNVGMVDGETDVHQHPMAG